MKKYLFGLLILNFPLNAISAEKIKSTISSEQTAARHKVSQHYYSLGVSYLDPVALNASFATTGGYLLLGHQFAPAWLDNSDFSIAAESKLSFGLKGEQHVSDYNGGYVIREGQLTYAASLVVKLNYAINDTVTVYATSGIDHFAWQYQLHDQSSVYDNMEFEDNNTALAWGFGLDYQFTDIAITTEMNALGFNIGLRKTF